MWCLGDLGRLEEKYLQTEVESSQGSHGDGEPECTQTPLVVWGSGVSETHPVRGDIEAAGHRGKGVIPETPRGEGGDGWGDLLRVERKDVEQAQVRQCTHPELYNGEGGRCRVLSGTMGMHVRAPGQSLGFRVKVEAWGCV